MQKELDVIVIGGGVVGSAVARELSRYKLDIMVLEKELDVCNDTSGRNTGLLHSGILQTPGSLSAECCLEANAEFEQVAEELDVPFKRCGKLFVGYGKEEEKRLNDLLRQGQENKVPGLRMITGSELKELEPEVEGDCALWVPSAGIMDPFTYTIALAENAAMNGVKYEFDQKVIGICYANGRYQVKTNHAEFSSRWVINCAGLYACEISKMLGYKAYIPDRIKGEYLILDKRIGEKLGHPVYPAPNEHGACDIHVTPTIDGNVLVGPTLQNIGDKVDYNTTQDMINSLGSQGLKMFRYVKRDYYIRSYAGNFPVVKDPDTNQPVDFQIQTSSEHPCSVNLVNITSPGLTSALPIARRVVRKVQEQENLEKKENFRPKRAGIIRFAEQDKEKQDQLIRENPEYGEVFCRCECVSKAEIRQAVHNILGVSTVSGVKYRTRATMGRCQGGYCETRITDMIQKELGKKKEDILLNKTDAYMFVGEVKSHDEA